MENPSKWYSRKHMGFIGFVLLVIGICMAIIFFPTVPLLSLLLFALIGGPGVFISYKAKNTRKILLIGFWVTSWGYPLGSLMFGVGFTDAFFYDFMGIVFPVVALGGVPFAWFGNRRWKTPEFSTFKNALVLYVIYLIVVLPFVFSGVWDYNVRADTSLPEVISMNVVSKYVNTEDMPYLTIKTPDGDLSYSLRVTYPFYDEHDIGSSIDVTVRRGALGYSWVERYE